MKPSDKQGRAGYGGVDSETESILWWKRNRYDWGLLTGLWQAAPVLGLGPSLENRLQVPSIFVYRNTTTTNLAVYLPVLVSWWVMPAGMYSTSPLLTLRTLVPLPSATSVNS